MSLPEFTPEEQFLINCVKSPKIMEDSYMWGYVLSGVVIGVFAAWYNSIPMMASAFAVVCGFRIYEHRYTSKWMPTWRSIIDKYERAAAETDTADHV